MHQAIILDYLGAPLITNFQGLKEEDAKYIIQYHNDVFSLKNPLPITTNSIYKIIGFIHGRNKILKIINYDAWISKFPHGITKKNSNGLIIYQFQDPQVKWDCIIAILCLTLAG